MYDTVDLGSMVIHEIRTLRYRGPLVTSRLWAPSLILILKLSPLLTTFRTPLSLMEFWMQVSICAEICAFLLTSSFPFECRASYFAASFFKIFNRWSHLGWEGLCCWCWWFHSNLTLLELSLQNIFRVWGPPFWSFWSIYWWSHSNVSVPMWCCSRLGCCLPYLELDRIWTY